jgi:hypothetical protein
MPNALIISKAWRKTHWWALAGPIVFFVKKLVSLYRNAAGGVERVCRGKYYFLRKDDENEKVRKVCGCGGCAVSYGDSCYVYPKAGAG